MVILLFQPLKEKITKSNDLLDKAIALDIMINDQKGLGVDYYNKGYALLELDCDRDSIGYFKQAIDIQKKNLDWEGVICDYECLIKACLKMDNYFEARKHWDDGTQLFEKYGDIQKLDRLNSAIGNEQLIDIKPGKNTILYHLKRFEESNKFEDCEEIQRVITKEIGRGSTSENYHNIICDLYKIILKIFRNEGKVANKNKLNKYFTLLLSHIRTYKNP
jgi:tetratricopeptide (TPR) repeat protein